MNDDLREIFSRPTEITLASGRKVHAVPLDFNDFTDLQAWLDTQQPSAFDAAHREIARGRLTLDDQGKWIRIPYPVDIQKFLFDIALAKDSSRRIFLGSPEADSVLRSEAGMAQIIRMSVRKGTPDIADAEVDEVLKMKSDAEKAAIAAKAEVPTSGRPKAPGPNGGPATAPMTAAATSPGGSSSGGSWSEG